MENDLFDRTQLSILLSSHASGDTSIGETLLSLLGVGKWLDFVENRTIDNRYLVNLQNDKPPE
jgi:hypothetical protein